VASGVPNTREYDAFCRRAFGAFLHHTPAVVLGEYRKSNEGLRRVWWAAATAEKGAGTEAEVAAAGAVVAAINALRQL
jgi:hypothetical protein